MWRVNTSSTQARQIHFSSCVTDSTGSADKSSGSIPTSGFERGPIFALAAFALDAPAVFAALGRAGFADVDAGDGFLAGAFFPVFEAGLARRTGIRIPALNLTAYRNTRLEAGRLIPHQRRLQVGQGIAHDLHILPRCRVGLGPLADGIVPQTQEESHQLRIVPAAIGFFLHDAERLG